MFSQEQRPIDVWERSRETGTRRVDTTGERHPYSAPAVGRTHISHEGAHRHTHVYKHTCTLKRTWILVSLGIQLSISAHKVSISKYPLS